ncbi:MAG: serine hydroxymethyltransferase [Candidatus Vogelbacteria bacterium CG10_big_fil_rev_8_21_14_0_10_50_13]|uniref:Serine hydroxymethyltransferase n=1 Tax=Candidatus Vogelbacteria bacterium CG10_big_fil_rev_8_21_14_0_10_50_13 TaxID=1975044 RepID=A0A2H0RFV8_9BACT|nr:MAG: serine hydroxymethyltransferase [Candidatus Vogelbacteria bacterium CG10_big_fil_rev_8_21_14_0_10_50_13]
MAMKDKPIERLIKQEEKRQKAAVNLIASENYVSAEVLKALGSELVNKYAEGYPGKRYYGGNEVIDQIEEECQKRALKLFKLKEKDWVVNVQPLSGSPANLAVYLALVKPGDKIMGMSLDHGGHLTHGHKVSISGKMWQPVSYGVDKKTEQLDYDEIEKIAKREKPALIVAGYTAYSRQVDWRKFRQIVNKIVHPEPGRRTILMVDMSHLAGLVAGGAYPSPFPYADVVTTTTHKTLRGPRAALIFSRRACRLPQNLPVIKGKSVLGQSASLASISDLIDKAVFPGIQGGPHTNQIAAVAVALREAMKPQFKTYAKQVVKNAKVLAGELKKLGWRIVSGGTDSHLFLVDTWLDGEGIGGKEASDKLERAGIIVNKNTIPFDARSPVDPSGIRIGTAAETTRGKKEKEMIKLAKKIDQILRQ